MKAVVANVKYASVTVEGEVSDPTLTALTQSMVLDGYTILPVRTKRISYSATANETVLEMRLYEGRNRQIRKMCETVHLRVTRLCRIAIGSLRLGNLAAGAWRRLTPREVAYLKGEISDLAHSQHPTNKER